MLQIPFSKRVANFFQEGYTDRASIVGGSQFFAYTSSSIKQRLLDRVRSITGPVYGGELEAFMLDPLVTVLANYIQDATLVSPHAQVGFKEKPRVMESAANLAAGYIVINDSLKLVNTRNVTQAMNWDSSVSSAIMEALNAAFSHAHSNLRGDFASQMANSNWVPVNFATALACIYTGGSQTAPSNQEQAIQALAKTYSSIAGAAPQTAEALWEVLKRSAKRGKGYSLASTDMAKGLYGSREDYFNTLTFVLNAVIALLDRAAMELASETQEFAAFPSPYDGSDVSSKTQNVKVQLMSNTWIMEALTAALWLETYLDLWENYDTVCPPSSYAVSSPAWLLSMRTTAVKWAATFQSIATDAYSYPLALQVRAFGEGLSWNEELIRVAPESPLYLEVWRKATEDVSEDSYSAREAVRAWEYVKTMHGGAHLLCGVWEALARPSDSQVLEIPDLDNLRESKYVPCSTPPLSQGLEHANFILSYVMYMSASVEAVKLFIAEEISLLSKMGEIEGGFTLAQGGREATPTALLHEQTFSRPPAGCWDIPRWVYPNIRNERVSRSARLKPAWTADSLLYNKHWLPLQEQALAKGKSSARNIYWPLTEMEVGDHLSAKYFQQPVPFLYSCGRNSDCFSNDAYHVLERMFGDDFDNPKNREFNVVVHSILSQQKVFLQNFVDAVASTLLIFTSEEAKGSVEKTAWTWQKPSFTAVYGVPPRALAVAQAEFLGMGANDKAIEKIPERAYARSNKNCVMIQDGQRAIAFVSLQVLPDILQLMSDKEVPSPFYIIAPVSTSTALTTPVYPAKDAFEPGKEDGPMSQFAKSVLDSVVTASIKVSDEDKSSPKIAAILDADRKVSIDSHIIPSEQKSSKYWESLPWAEVMGWTRDLTALPGVAWVDGFNDPDLMSDVSPVELKVRQGGDLMDAALTIKDITDQELRSLASPVIRKRTVNHLGKVQFIFCWDHTVGMLTSEDEDKILDSIDPIVSPGEAKSPISDVTSPKTDGVRKTPDVTGNPAPPSVDTAKEAAVAITPGTSVPVVQPDNSNSPGTQAQVIEIPDSNAAKPIQVPALGPGAGDPEKAAEVATPSRAGFSNNPQKFYWRRKKEDGTYEWRITEEDSCPEGFEKASAQEYLAALNEENNES